MPLSVHVTWIGKKTTIALLAHSYPDVNFIPIDAHSSLYSLTHDLRHLDLLVDLQSNFRSWRLGLLFRLRVRHAFQRLKKASFARGLLVCKAFFAGRRGGNLPPTPGRDELQYRKMLACLRHALDPFLPETVRAALHTQDFPPYLPLPAGALAPHFSSLERCRTILAIAPGASFANKQAPISLVHDILSAVLVQLSRQAPRRDDIALLLLGDHADGEICLQLMQQVEWCGPVLNLAGKVSLEECGQLLARSRCLLSNDSSLSHLAEAVGIPSVVLFGPTVEAFGFTPWQKTSRAFSLPLGCRPCSKHGKSPCRYHDRRCFMNIPRAQVADYLVRLLSEN